MKKTYMDRVNLIDRLERKYARKIQLRAQRRRQNVRNALRVMRGSSLNSERMRSEALEGIFQRGSKIAF